MFFLIKKNLKCVLLCCGYLQNHFMGQFYIGFVPKVLLLDLSMSIQIQRGYDKLRTKFETLCLVDYISVTLSLNVVSLESLFISFSNHVLFLKIMHFFSFEKQFCCATVRLFSWY